jgi:hypothetical protein
MAVDLDRDGISARQIGRAKSGIGSAVDYVPEFCHSSMAKRHKFVERVLVSPFI